MSELPPQPSAPVVVLAVGAVILLVLMVPMCYCCLMFLCRHVFTSAPTTPAELGERHRLCHRHHLQSHHR